MTCKDCVHYDVCVIVEHSDTDYDHYSEYGCEDFKNKADFAEVVRCENCKFYEEVEYFSYDSENPTKNVCRLLTRQMQSDDFCSYGERGTENADER